MTKMVKIKSYWIGASEIESGPGWSTIHYYIQYEMEGDRLWEDPIRELSMTLPLEIDEQIIKFPNVFIADLFYPFTPDTSSDETYRIENYINLNNNFP